MYSSPFQSTRLSSVLEDSQPDGEFELYDHSRTSISPHYQSHHRALIRPHFSSAFRIYQSTLSSSSTLLSRDAVHIEPSTDSFRRKDLLDFFNFLPPEICVEILLHLPPQDLCNASSVCSRWYLLTQHTTALRKRRKDYVQEKREEYQKSKENYRLPDSTSPTPAHQQQGQYTKAPSPLSIVQPTSPLTWRDNSRSLTPSPTLLDGVSNLSLEDNQEIVLCRPLFPEFSLLPPPAGDAKLSCFSSPVSRQSREVAGRKFNKNRLRRL